ncbi:MAG: hypothetical protein GYB31_12000 [Bacteroidetes bacterium]|nr:hypothetical protein [Bacteroidota bacterium]
MDILTGMLLITGVIMLVVVTRIITPLIHELGHAIPALLFSKEEVEVFVGSYAHPGTHFGFKLGRLHLFFRFKIQHLYAGLCRHAEVQGYPQSLWIVLGGPLASLLFAVLMAVWIVHYPLGDYGMLVLAVLLISSIWDFLVNIIPSSQPIQMGNGGYVFNDGYRLREIWQSGQQYETLQQARQAAFAEGNQSAISHLEALPQNEQLSRSARIELARMLVQENRIPEAAEHFNAVYTDLSRIKVRDYDLFGDIHYGLNNIREALEAWNKYLHIHFQDWKVINKRARALIDLGYPDAAAKEIASSLHFNNQTNTGALLNRVRIGMQEGTLVQVQEDLLQLRQMDEDDPQMHLYYGFYYEKIGNTPDAEFHYRKAKETGTKYHGIDLKIEEMRIQNGR